MKEQMQCCAIISPCPRYLHNIPQLIYIYIYIYIQNNITYDIETLSLHIWVSMASMTIKLCPEQGLRYPSAITISHYGSVRVSFSNALQNKRACLLAVVSYYTWKTEIGCFRPLPGRVFAQSNLNLLCTLIGWVFRNDLPFVHVGQILIL